MCLPALYCCVRLCLAILYICLPALDVAGSSFDFQKHKLFGVYGGVMFFYFPLDCLLHLPFYPHIHLAFRSPMLSLLRRRRRRSPGIDLLRGVGSLLGAGPAEPMLGEAGAPVRGDDQVLHVGLQRRELGLRDAGLSFLSCCCFLYVYALRTQEKVTHR